MNPDSANERKRHGELGLGLGSGGRRRRDSESDSDNQEVGLGGRPDDEGGAQAAAPAGPVAAVGDTVLLRVDPLWDPGGGANLRLWPPWPDYYTIHVESPASPPQSVAVSAGDDDDDRVGAAGMAAGRGAVAGGAAIFEVAGRHWQPAARATLDSETRMHLGAAAAHDSEVQQLTSSSWQLLGRRWREQVPRALA